MYLKLIKIWASSLKVKKKIILLQDTYHLSVRCLVGDSFFNENIRGIGSDKRIFVDF